MRSMKWVLVGVVCLVASPVFAGKPVCGDGKCQGKERTTCPSDCSGSGGGDVRLYGVTIDGPLLGLGEDWQERPAKKIVLGSPPPVYFLYVDFFRDVDGPFSSRGPTCFPDNPVALFGALIKEKSGLAQGMFWFRGQTDDGSTEVLYQLGLSGTFDPDKDWPPSGDLGDFNVVEMTTWHMGVENEGKEIKNKSCLGAGAFPDGPVVITVVRTR